MGPSLRLGLVLTTSSISCTPSVPSSTGTSERVWRRVSSQRLVRILLPLRRITKRSVLIPSRVRARRRARNIKLSHSLFHLNSICCTQSDIHDLSGCCYQLSTDVHRNQTTIKNQT